MPSASVLVSPVEIESWLCSSSKCCLQTCTDWSGWYYTALRESMSIRVNWVMSFCWRKQESYVLHSFHCSPWAQYRELSSGKWEACWMEMAPFSTHPTSLAFLLLFNMCKSPSSGSWECQHLKWAFSYHKSKWDWNQDYIRLFRNWLA